MIYISCSDEEYENIVDILTGDDVPCIFVDAPCLFFGGTCRECIKNRIKRINTDITPDTPNYKTEAENKAFLQGFNVASKKMGGEVKDG